MTELVQLIGQDIDNESIRQFVADLGTPLLMHDDEETYYEFPRQGIDLLFDEKRMVKAIHLYSQGREKYDQYRGELPDSLVFEDTISSVVAKLGKPTVVGGGTRSILYSTVPAWVRYDRLDHKLHIEFKAANQPVSLITLMAR